MKKVVKFGGSSLASAEQFKKVGDIIRADADRKYVVPSAPGKRFSEDTKVTDMLYNCYSVAESGKKFKDLLNKIQDRYNEIIQGLGLDLSLDNEFKTLFGRTKQKAQSKFPNDFQYTNDWTGLNIYANYGIDKNGIFMCLMTRDKSADGLVLMGDTK